MKKSLYLFIFCFSLLGYNCISWGGWLSDVTDAAKSTVNKAKGSSKRDETKETPVPSRKEENAEKIASALQKIKQKVLNGEELDIEDAFKTSYYLQGLSSEEISKAITDNRQELDNLITEQKRLKNESGFGKLQEAWQHFIEVGGEEARKEYKEACEKYLSPDQINSENFRYSSVKIFDSRVKLYKDIYSGTSCAWLINSPLIGTLALHAGQFSGTSCAWLIISPFISGNPNIGACDKFRVAVVSGKDGNNELVFLFSNGENLLPQGQDNKNLFQCGAFAAIVTFGEGVTSEDVLKKNESVYGKFQKTTTKGYITLEPFNKYRLACETETWVFENDSIKIQIQQLVCREGKAEEIAESSPDYPRSYARPNPGEIDAMVKKLNSRPQPVTMSIFDMKRVKKLNALYQEELNALNAKRQASEKLAQDKADQAKKDALNF